MQAEVLKQGETLLYDVGYTAIVAGGAVLIGLIVHGILAALLKRRQDRRTKAGKRAGLRLDYLKAPLRSLIPAIFVSAVLPLSRLPKGPQGAFSHVVGLWVIVSFAWLAAKAVTVAQDAVLGRFDLQITDNLQARRVSTQARFIERVLVAVIFFIAVAVGLMTFAKVRQFGVSLLASAGLIGIILGFAAQKMLGNLLAGIQIAFAQPIRLDDVVIVENEWGWIEEITLTYVIVRIWDKRRLVLPISYFVEHPFQNWTRRTADIMGTVFIYADYSIPVPAVREELKRIVEASPLWDRKVCSLQVTNATERSLELRALVSAAESSALWDLRCEVREKLLEFLRRRYPESLPRVRVAAEHEEPPAAAPPAGQPKEPEDGL